MKTDADSETVGREKLRRIEWLRAVGMPLIESHLFVPLSYISTGF